KFTMKWISAHSEVERNERVDEEAKAAAEGKSSHWTTLPDKLFYPLPFSVSSLVQETKGQAKVKWKQAWDKSPRKAQYDKIDDQFPPRQYLAI
ncbi:hypothetical protein FA13DRAFT_1584993, partial [Coprinellus micaceus]